MPVSVKLQGARSEGGRRLAPSQLNHPSNEETATQGPKGGQDRGPTSIPARSADLTPSSLGNPYGSVNPVNTILYTEGAVGEKKTRVVIDSGAAVSVVRQELVSDRDLITQGSTQWETVGANGTPLHTVGRVTLVVSLGNFRSLWTSPHGRSVWWGEL